MTSIPNLPKITGKDHHFLDPPTPLDKEPSLFVLYKDKAVSTYTATYLIHYLPPHMLPSSLLRTRIFDFFKDGANTGFRKLKNYVLSLRRNLKKNKKPDQN